METETIGRKTPKLIVLVGCQGTGKSTWAKSKVDEDDSYIIVNRDNIRRLLFGLGNDFQEYFKDSEKLFSKEKLVTAFEKSMVIEGSRLNKNVILDATHSQQKYIKDVFMRYTPYFGLDNIEIKIFGDYYEEIFKKTYWARTLERELNPIPYESVSKTFERIKNLIQDFPHKLEEIKKEVGEVYTLQRMNNPNNTPCVIFDIDGTLADHDGRNPYEYIKCLNDKVVLPVKELNNILDETNDYKIIICSGRPDEFRELTEKWLKDNNIYYDELRMRDSRDYRSDFVVKSEMWRSIMKDYYIAFMIDDRTQVVEHARNCGFFVYQVQNKIY